MAQGDIWMSTEPVAPRVAAGRFSFGWQRLGAAAPGQDEFWKKTRRKRSSASNVGGLELVVLVDLASPGGAHLATPEPSLFWLGVEAGADRSLQIVTANPPRVIEATPAGPGAPVAVRLHVVADPDGKLFVRET